jgi:hypothetical protein
MAYGRFQCLVANGRFQCLVVFGRFQCLVALERFQRLVAFERRRRIILFTYFHFRPQQFYLNFFFSIHLKVLLYHGSRPLFYVYFFIFLLINCNHASWCTKSSTHSSSSWFWLKIFIFIFIFLSLSSWHRTWAIFMGYTSEWRTTSEIIPKFNIDATSSWWRSRTARSAPLSWN